MNDITFDNGGKFTLLILEDFYDDRSEKYKSFLESNKISSIKCVMPTGLNFQVPGDRHPNEISNYQTYECIKKKLKIE